MIVNVSGTALSINVWKQERLVFHVYTSVNSVKVWTNLHGSSLSPLAAYTPDADNDTYIDMTDYVRTYPSVTNIYVYSVLTCNISVTIAGLINPANVIIPDNAMLQKIGGTGILCPPAMMIEPVNSLDTLSEVYGYAGGTISYFDGNNTSLGSYPLTTQAVTIPNNADNIRYYKGSGTSIYKQYFAPMRCGIRYCAVKWVSFTGQTRQHTFEVEQCKIAADASYSLLPIDNEYIDIKGREDSFKLHLGGLCAYDLWYYADILMSSKVEVSFDGVTFDRVQVTDKNITIPDGEAGTKGELDINVNWKRYDAVAM